MKIALVGSPNVGKSVIFHHLTGQYVNVSNYPGTTVEVTWGTFRWGGEEAEVVDTPGIYSLLPISGEEQVTRRLLFVEEPDLVVHIVDAKNVQRMLTLTLQLLEAGLRVVLVLNMMDELRQRRLFVDSVGLSSRLGIPVLPAVSITGEGIGELKHLLGTYLVGLEPLPDRPVLRLPYPAQLEKGISRLQNCLKGSYTARRRALILFLLQGDEEAFGWLNGAEETQQMEWLRQVRTQEWEGTFQQQEVITQIALARQRKVGLLLKNVFDDSTGRTPRIQAWLSRLCTRPLTGIPILLVVLYFGVYRFVGSLGAGVVVDFLDGVVFQQWLNPLFTGWVQRLVPSVTLQALFIGEYGILTLGLRYAVAIILPVVGMFFLAFSLLEDSGYFPRLALLIDRLFKVIGLNGRAVIPMVLGLGCDTMATLTTRILETRKERILATFLLALAVPCSAQLGVITALLAEESGGILIWLGVVMGVLVLAGYLGQKVLPGERVGFYMEVPALRWPKLTNILAKTKARMEWYFLEILPVFIYSSVIIWIGQLTGLFDLLLRWLHPLMIALGLPREAAVTFLFGFFRRDYGAAGLFDLHRQGLVGGDGLIVACITLTLFVPCVAQFAVMLKEHGLRTGLLISSIIFPLAFLVGYLVRLILQIF